MNFPDEPTITKGLCDAWLMSKPGGNPNGLQHWATVIRQLAKYMNALGHAAYVIPGNALGKRVKYEAHIYTHAEAKAFFNAVDRCPPSSWSPTRVYVMPVIFRLLYCCGMRSSEARLLKRDDIDLKTGKIVVRESKGWKARVVYMSGDLLSVCKEYDSIVSGMFPGREAFFPNRYGRFFCSGILADWFHKIWDDLPEARAAAGNTARVHDWRHGYAVHRINRWVKDGEDINALYPYLSEYMGHSHYASTDYYLSLVEDFYPEMEKRLSSVNEGILPEVCYEEG
jgi:integrase